VTRVLLLALLVVVAVLGLIEALRLSGPPRVLPAQPGDPPPVVSGQAPWPHDGGPLEAIDARRVDPAAALRIGTQLR
jgi:hypothetical protein